MEFVPYGEQLLFKTSTKVQGQNEAGIFAITNLRVLWAKEGVQKTVDLPFNEYKGVFTNKKVPQGKPVIKITKDTDPKSQGVMFEFISTVSLDQAWIDRDKASSVIIPLVKQFSKPTTTASSQSNGSTTTTPLSNPNNNNFVQPVNITSTTMQSKLLSGRDKELKQRANLLAANVELRNLYDKLVKETKTLTDEEFWESRKATLQNEMSKASNQGKGVPSSLLADFRPTSTSSQTVQYKLTPQLIQQIFVMYPKVKRVYDENVPDKMSEKEFWTKYFEAFRVYKENRGITTISNQTSANEMFYKVISEQDKDSEEPIIIKKKLKNLDRTVDISAEVDDKEPGYGVVIDQQDPAKIAKNLSMLRRFNRHSALVLGEIDEESATNAQPAKKLKLDKPASTQTNLTEELKIRDLDDDKQEDTVPLNIKHTQVYFDTQQTTTTTSNGNGKTSNTYSDAFRRIVAGLTTSTENAIVSENVALAITNELFGGSNLVSSNSKTNAKLSPFSSTMYSQNGASSNEEKLNLDEETTKQLYTYFGTANELLRHFWSCFPLRSDPQKIKKAERMIESIEKLHTKLEDFKRSAPMEKRSILNHLVNPILNGALHKAISKWQESAPKLK